ncbi:BAG family molecular chaperone regulator 3-like, partial, partial [Paramuricea clavata]
MATSGQLPPGWEARWDDQYGRYYFINHFTQNTTWTDPRLAHVGAQHYRPVEQIPMQEFSSRQSSAQSHSRGQTSSAARTKETGFQYSIDPSNDEDDEDDEWRDALLRSSMENNQQKRLLFHDKINMKEKFKREFKELDAHVVENTVEK